MSRVRKFGFAVDVSGEFRRDDPARAAEYAHQALREKANRIDLRGPRGGRFERIGELFGFDDGNLAHFDRDQRTYVCFTNAVYVRPNPARFAVGSAVGPDAPSV